MAIFYTDSGSISILEVSSSFLVSGSATISGSLVVTQGITGSFSGSITEATSASFALTASYWSGSILNSTSASFASTASIATSSSYALTASFALNAGGGAFPFTGSAQITGSLGVTGSVTATSFTGSLFGTSSWASNALTASYILNAVSSSFASTASIATSSSYALTASYALTGGTGGAAFPFTGSARITGSLTVVGPISASSSITSSGALFDGSGGTNVVQISGNGTTSSTNSILVRNSSGTSIFTVRDDSFVGIGTDAPTDRLSIVSSDSTNIFGRISANAAGATAAWVAQNDLVDNVIYRVFGSSAVGTQLGVPIARGGSLLANLGGGVGKFLVGTFSTSDFLMGTANTERIRISGSGNIGIGTTNPQFGLDVAVASRFTIGVQVTGSLAAASITGSLLGTGSFAVSSSRAISSSYADTVNLASIPLSPATKTLIVTYPTATENISFFYTDTDFTVGTLFDVVRGTTPSVTYNIQFNADRSSGAPTNLLAASRTTTSTVGVSTSAFANATIPGGSWVWLTTSAASAGITEFTVTLQPA